MKYAIVGLGITVYVLKELFLETTVLRIAVGIFALSLIMGSSSITNFITKRLQ